ncbi:MAG TPA: EamA family transporter [Desulfotomaculum sp.]|nr:EamA family transporter [Desulfotomaculum sp.]
MKTGVLDTRAYIAYSVVCIVWGSTYLAIRIGVSDLPPALFAGVRFIIAGSLMLAYVKLKGLEMPRTLKDIRIIATVGLFLLFGGNGLVVWSEQFIASGLTALIISTVPLFVALLDLIFPGGTRMNWKGWTGLLIGFGGVGVLVLPGTGLHEVDLKGVIGVLAGAFLWASGSLYSSRNSVSGSMLSISALEMLAAGTALCLTGLAAGEAPLFHLTVKGAGALLYLIFFGSIIGFSCFVYIIKAMPPAKASTYSYINPVVAIFLGWLVLNESVSLRDIAGAFIILTGVVLVQTARFGQSGAGPMDKDGPERTALSPADSGKTI